jgi:hypothetical protein
VKDDSILAGLMDKDLDSTYTQAIEKTLSVNGPETHSYENSIIFDWQPLRSIRYIERRCGWFSK